MVDGGSFKLKLNPNYLVISLAIAFVLYHLWQSFVGTTSFALAYLPHSTAPVVQHKSTPTPTPTLISGLVQTGLTNQQADWPTRVVISKVGINLPLLGTMEHDGTWDVSATQANYATNTAIPNGITGNTVIFGHDRYDLFHPIHNLDKGDEVAVTAGGRTYVYAVSEIKVVQPTDISIFNQTKDSTITLITCNGLFVDNRYIVIGKFIRVENPANYYN